MTTQDMVQLKTQGILKKLQEAQKLITDSIEDLTRGEKLRKDLCKEPKVWLQSNEKES